MVNLLKIAFYCGFLSCGLAVLRHTKLQLLLYIYPAAFCTAFVFSFINNAGYSFVAGLAGGFTAAVIIGISHRLGRHGYLFIVIPVIYCIGPGGSLYKLFLAMFNCQWSVMVRQRLSVIKVAVGIWWGILAGTATMNKITGKKSEEF
ncbi:MAG: hypothetical protein IJ410_05715 [Oscillospiraceae bacterium]|nr:hypothetical protein [Oscillospiraceae bacterium]